MRILTPESGAPRGVYLDIHGGGFYLGCAARGMLATVASPTPRSRHGRFVGAALQFGTYDLSGQSSAGRLLAEEYFIQAYVGQVADRTNPDISPLVRRPPRPTAGAAHHRELGHRA